MTTDADGWIEHDGKGMPVDKGTRVQVRMRDGEEGLTPYPAREWLWGESGDGTITHYRIVDEPKPAATEPVMTLRDQFAIAAVPYFLDTLPPLPKGAEPGLIGSILARHAYEFADAMMAERSKK